MGLYKAYHEWQVSMVELEHSLEYMFNQINQLKDDDSRGKMLSDYGQLLKSFSHTQLTCENLANLIDDNL